MTNQYLYRILSFKLNQIKLVLLFLILAVSQSASYGQVKTKAELQAERAKRQQEIAETKKVLNDVKVSQKKTVTFLMTLSSQIKNREYLIDNANKQVDLLESDITVINDSISLLENDLEQMKRQYARMVVDAYKTRNKYNKLAYVFSSKNVQQASKRMKYLKLLSDSRTRQLKLIKEKTLELNDKKDRLLGVKKNKEVLIDDKEHEKTELETDKKEQQQVFTELKGKEKELMKKLKEQKESIRKLDNAIAEIIAREIEAARKRAAEETARKRKELEEKQKLEREKAIKEGRKPEELKPSANEEKKFTRTAEDERLTSDFSGNKGKLPWPVEQGFVIGGFGAHAHPTLKNVMVQNNGIDISTNKGASVRAVFKGTVKAVFSVPGMEKCVMINHGDFFTVYCHLKDVNVKVGDVVATKQKIGTVFTDEDEDRTVVQFQLWRNTDKQNPELWLAR